MDWKKKHANESERAMEHPLVIRYVESLYEQIEANSGPPPKYMLYKTASIAAQVARAQALGFDPELLRLPEEQGDNLMWELAARAVYEGVPVHRLEG